MNNQTVHRLSIFVLAIIITTYLFDQKGRKELPSPPKKEIIPSGSLEENTYLNKVAQLISDSLIRFEYEIVDTFYSPYDPSVEGRDKLMHIASHAIKYKVINESNDTIYYLTHTCDNNSENLNMDRNYYKQLFWIACNASFPIYTKISPNRFHEYVIPIERLYAAEEELMMNKIEYIFIPLTPNLSDAELRQSERLELYYYHAKVLKM